MWFGVSVSAGSGIILGVTVRQLIENLSALDQDALVIAPRYDESLGDAKIESVFIVNDGDGDYEITADPTTQKAVSISGE